LENNKLVAFEVICRLCVTVQYQMDHGAGLFEVQPDHYRSIILLSCLVVTLPVLSALLAFNSKKKSAPPISIGNIRVAFYPSGRGKMLFRMYDDNSFKEIQEVLGKVSRL
jgi:hypothetical protein